jgi:hypothetical protein
MSNDDGKPPSGDWIGFYQQHGCNHVTEMFVEYDDDYLTGSGRDTVGEFSIQGTYDSTTRELSWIKAYHGAHSVHYRGFYENGSIWGVWTVSTMARGGFRIWPKDTAARTAWLAIAARPAAGETVSFPYPRHPDIVREDTSRSEWNNEEN